MPNPPPDHIRAEAALCRERAAGCSDAESAEDWLALAAAFEKVAVIAERKALQREAQRD